MFETHPANAGKAWLVWGNAVNVSRKQWDSATNSWGAATTVGDDAALVQLLALLQSRTVLAAVYEDSQAVPDDIWEMHLTGGGAVWTAPVVIWGGPGSGTGAGLYCRRALCPHYQLARDTSLKETGGK